MWQVKNLRETPRHHQEQIETSSLHWNQIPWNDMQIMFSTNVIFQQKMFVGGLALQFPHSKNNSKKKK